MKPLKKNLTEYEEKWLREKKFGRSTINLSMIILIVGMSLSCTQKIKCLEAKRLRPTCAESVYKIRKDILEGNLSLPSPHEVLDLVECVELMESGYE